MFNVAGIVMSVTLIPFAPALGVQPITIVAMPFNLVVVENWVGLSGPAKMPDDITRRLADETGGGYFQLRRTDDPGPTFSPVAQELHSQYTLGFTPSVLDGKEHKLAVRMKQAGMTGRARRSYVASSERLTSTQ